MESEVLELIKQKLPKLLTGDPQFREWVWRIVHEYALLALRQKTILNDCSPNSNTCPGTR